MRTRRKLLRNDLLRSVLRLIYDGEAYGWYFHHGNSILALVLLDSWSLENTAGIDAAALLSRIR